MAAVLNRVKVNLKNVSSTVTVPSNPKARLMYYLNSMCTVLDLSQGSSVRRLTDYSNYQRLSTSETDELLALCIVLSPDVLLDKCIFHSEEMCGNSSNKFYELTTARQTLAVSENIVIGGQTREVRCIMTFKMAWLQNNYFLPLASFQGRLNELISDQTPLLGGGTKDGDGECSVGCCLCTGLKVIGAIICCPVFCIWACFCRDAV